MAYTLDRNGAARRLGVSTRTVDRHIQAERIRTRRIGKKIFLEEDDIEAIRNNDPARKNEDYVVVIKDDEPEISEKPAKTTTIAKKKNLDRAIAEFSRIYNDAQAAIEKKDEVIQDLSYKLGKIENALENTVDAGEYKRTAYLLESAKTKNESDKEHYADRVTRLEKEIEKRNSALVGLVILFVLVLVSSLLFFLWNRLI